MKADASAFARVASPISDVRRLQMTYLEVRTSECMLRVESILLKPKVKEKTDSRIALAGRICRTKGIMTNLLPETPCFCVTFPRLHDSCMLGRLLSSIAGALSTDAVFCHFSQLSLLLVSDQLVA